MQLYWTEIISLLSRQFNKFTLFLVHVHAIMVLFQEEFSGKTSIGLWNILFLTSKLFLRITHKLWIPPNNILQGLQCLFNDLHLGDPV